MHDGNALKEAEAARYLSVSVSFLRQARSNSKHRSTTPGPKYVRIGRSVRYIRSDLDKFLAENRVPGNACAPVKANLARRKNSVDRAA
jgi:predicted DNA-binding transcriptional regulator AlpA